MASRIQKRKAPAPLTRAGEFALGADYALTARRMALHGVVTRQQLQQETGLSPGALTKHIRWLRERGFVQIRRVPVPTAKKPIDELWLDPAAATFLCVAIGHNRVAGELTGLDLKPMYRYEAHLERFTQSAILQALVETVECSRQAAARFGRSIDFLGISVAGLVDAVDGIIFGMHDVPGWQACQPWLLFPEIHVIPRVHIWPETACKAAGLCVELKQDRNVAYLEIANGRVSMASVANGELHIGNHGTSGHLLHVSVSSEPLPCYCGKRGCFQQYLNSSRIPPKIMRKGLEAVCAAFPDAELAIETDRPELVSASIPPTRNKPRLHPVRNGEAYILQGLRLLSARAAVGAKVAMS
jgi:predicted NBD/HSP70 family sugar kinase